MRSGTPCFYSEKDLDGDAFEKEAGELKELCGRYHVPFVVNDSVEIAMDIGADGVHVGQSDIRGRDIRAMIGPDKILGISPGRLRMPERIISASARYSAPVPRRTPEILP